MAYSRKIFHSQCHAHARRNGCFGLKSCARRGVTKVATQDLLVARVILGGRSLELFAALTLFTIAIFVRCRYRRSAVPLCAADCAVVCTGGPRIHNLPSLRLPLTVFQPDRDCGSHRGHRGGNTRTDCYHLVAWHAQVSRIAAAPAAAAAAVMSRAVIPRAPCVLHFAI